MQRRTRIALVVVALVTVFAAVRASFARHVPGDFLRYHRAGRLVATGRVDVLYDAAFRKEASVYAAERAADAAERGADADPYPEATFKYLPATAVLLAPLGALHPRTANVLWAAWNGFLIGGLFAALWWRFGHGRSGWWMLLPLLAMLRIANDNLNLGQLNPSAIVPGSFAVLLLAAPCWRSAADRRWRPVAAGLLAAFGAVVKFMPVFLALWFAWKRQYRALGAMLLGIALLGVALPFAALGPERARTAHREYFGERAEVYTSATPDDLPGDSIKSFVYRVLGDVPFEKYGHVARISLVRLPEPVLYWGVIAADLLLLALVLRACGRAERTDPLRAGLEGGLFLAALLLVSPEARGPHFLYLAVGAVALTDALVAARPRRLAPTLGALALAGLLLNANSTTIFGKEGAATLGAFCPAGFATAIVMVAIVLALRRLTRAEPVPARVG